MFMRNSLRIGCRLSRFQYGMKINNIALPVSKRIGLSSVRCFQSMYINGGGSTNNSTSMGRKIFKVIGYTFLGSSVVGIAYGMYLWNYFKTTLMIRACMTIEELEECRAAAMNVIKAYRSMNTYIDEEALTDDLAERFYVNARHRLREAPEEEYQILKKEIENVAWDYFSAIFEEDADIFELIMLECRYYLIYKPEEVLLALQSDEGKEMLEEGLLLTIEEIEALGKRDSGSSGEHGGFDDGFS